MFGGFYLGQIYLGLAELPIFVTIYAQPASHQLYSDNVVLTQKHVLSIDDSYHATSSTLLSLLQHQILVVDDAVHALSESNIILTERYVPHYDVIPEDDDNEYAIDSIPIKEYGSIEVQENNIYEVIQQDGI